MEMCKQLHNSGKRIFLATNHSPKQDKVKTYIQKDNEYKKKGTNKPTQEKEAPVDNTIQYII